MKIAKFELSLFGINTYIVYDTATKDCAIIDPGMITQQELNMIANFIDRNGLNVTQIINTHSHIDHIIGNKWLKDIYNVPVASHEADDALADRAAEQAQMFGLPFKVEVVKSDVKLKAGDVIKIGEGELKVIHVPGHSPGSVALYDEKDGFLISGDALFEGSIGRTDLPGGSYQTLINSIRHGLMTLPGNTVVYPGHGSETTIDREMRENPFLK